MDTKLDKRASYVLFQLSCFSMIMTGRSYVTTLSLITFDLLQMLFFFILFNG